MYFIYVLFRKKNYKKIRKKKTTKRLEKKNYKKIRKKEVQKANLTVFLQFPPQISQNLPAADFF
jgi:hypothetical protein